MAISYVTNALGATNSTTSFSITLPTTEAGDILILEFTHRGTGDGTIAGTSVTTGGLTWTKKHSRLYASSAFAGLTYWTRATGNHSGQTVTGADLTNSCAAILTVYRGALASGDPLADATIVGEENASGNEGQAAITTTTNGAYVVLVVANSPDVAVTSMAAANLTLTARAERLSTGGTDTSIAHASGPLATAGSSGAFTWSQTDGAGGSWAYAITPAPEPYSLAVTEVDLTPSGATVAGEQTVAADIGEITPAGQAIALILSTVMAVTAASVTPDAKAVALEATYSVPVTAASITPAGQDVTLTAVNSYTLAADQASITPATQDVTVSYTAGATLPVTVAEITPSGGVVAAEQTVAAEIAELGPVGQDITLSYTSGYRITVAQADLTPATQDVTLVYAASYTLPVAQAAITPSGKDLTLTATGQSSFSLPVDVRAMQPSGSTVGAEHTSSAAPAQIEPVTYDLTLTATQYRLTVTQAAITPTGYDVDYADDRQFDQCQIIPAGQDITLDAQRRVDVTAASVQPTTQGITFRARLPVESLSMPPARGTIGTAQVWPFDALSIAPSGSDLLFQWSDNPDLLVDAGSVTPAGQAIAFRHVFAVEQASVQPAGQELGTNWRGPVTAAQVQHASVGIRMDVALPVGGIAVQAQPYDVQMRYAGEGVLPVLAASVQPVGQGITLIVSNDNLDALGRWTAVAGGRSVSAIGGRNYTVNGTRTTEKRA